MYKFDTAIGEVSANRVILDDRRLKNTAADEDCRIWLGVGNFCLCMDADNFEINGLCGDIDSADIARGDSTPCAAIDGRAALSGGKHKISGAVYLCCDLTKILYDGTNNRLVFGDTDGCEISFRVAQNLIVALKNELVCGVVVEDVVLPK